MSAATSSGFSSPIPTRASKAAVHAFAEDAARRLNFGPSEPIFGLVSRIGGQVEFKNPERHDGRLPESIIVRAMHDFTIFVPNMTSAERDRFTIAHELGHYYLHYPMASRLNPGLPMIATRWVDEADDEQKRAEWEANWFAAAFLMPEQLFKQMFKTHTGDLARIAAFFCVSGKAASVRASVLGLV